MSTSSKPKLRVLELISTPDAVIDIEVPDDMLLADHFFKRLRPQPGGERRLCFCFLSPRIFK